MSTLRRVLSVVLLAVLVASLLPTPAFAADDWDVPGGHFFTQTGGGSGKGYTVINDGNAKFWSEFQRLGGIAAVGYPSSRRFSWDGFTVQVFQRVVFQWHTDTGTVAFVNTFDRLHDLGKDDWLLATKQTPRPASFDEQGKSWNQVVAGRLALLDAAPAIKTKYYAVVGDPIQANGLPTSPVTDMGNNYSLRAQRVVFQLWKQDVPWAKAGSVTVALGGDISKDASILPDQGALQPGTPADLANGTTTPAVQWATYSDAQLSFQYPSDWRPTSAQVGAYTLRGYAAPSGDAAIEFEAPYVVTGDEYYVDYLDLLGRVRDIAATAGGPVVDIPTVGLTTINGYSATTVQYQTRTVNPIQNFAIGVHRGNKIYHIEGFAHADKYPGYESTFTAVFQSFMPKQD